MAGRMPTADEDDDVQVLAVSTGTRAARRSNNNNNNSQLLVRRQASGAISSTTGKASVCTSADRRMRSRHLSESSRPSNSSGSKSSTTVATVCIGESASESLSRALRRAPTTLVPSSSGQQTPAVAVLDATSLQQLFPVGTASVRRNRGTALEQVRMQRAWPGAVAEREEGATVLSSDDDFKDGPVRSVKRPASVTHETLASTLGVRGRQRPRLRVPGPRLRIPTERRAQSSSAIVVDDDEDDRVIETCRSFEEAFFGVVPAAMATEGALLTVPRRAPRPMDTAFSSDRMIAQDTTLTFHQQSEAALPEHLAVLSCKNPAARLRYQSISVPESRLRPCSPSATNAGGTSSSSSCVDFAAQIELPQRLSFPVPTDKPFALPEAVKEKPESLSIMLPEMPEQEEELSALYVEHLRVSSGAGRCSACGILFSVGQLRLGYMPDSADADSGHADVRWVHAPACLTSDGLRVNSASEWVSFSPEVSNESKNRVLGVLGVLPPSLPELRPDRPVLRARLWRHGPAQFHRWARLQPAGPGMARRPPAGSSTASGLSAVAQEARVILANGWRVNQARHVARRGPAGPVLNRDGEENRTTYLRVTDRQAPAGTAEDRLAAAELASREVRQRTAVAAARPGSERVRSGRGRGRGRGRGGAMPNGKISRELRRAAPVIHLVRDYGQEPCVICHEPMVAGEDVRTLPCLHAFHRYCIDRWLIVKACCPLDNMSADELLARHRKMFQELSRLHTNTGLIVFLLHLMFHMLGFVALCLA
ncbi:unnamed protein product [Polarella glacialis]|uniref:RING-type domain-containing protein n=2 Tax=Polarella glacialis TaxID=89957 RepID=A0A813F3E6_POLGL|nr:unnamed protein product [Polarella glacialis]